MVFGIQPEGSDWCQGKLQRVWVLWSILVNPKRCRATLPHSVVSMRLVPGAVATRVRCQQSRLLLRLDPVATARLSTASSEWIHRAL